MGNNQPSLSANNRLFIISLLAIVTFLLQFIFRSFDDNRLTSWQWAFQNIDAAGIYLILSAGFVPVFFISKISLSVRYYPLFLFVAAFIAAAFFWTEPEVIVDSSRYFTQAKHLELYGVGYFVREWGKDIHAWTDMPLVPFLYGLVFRFFGESRIYIQILTTTLFSLSVVLTYELGKTLWDKETGFFAGVLLLGMPYLLTQVPLMLVDVPAMFFLMLAVVAFIRAMRQGGAWIIFSSIAVFLAFFSKYSAWPMLSVLGVIFLVYLIKNRGLGEGGSLKIPSPSRGEGEGGGGNSELLTPNYIHRGALIVSIAALLIGVVFLYKSDVFLEQIKLLMTFQKPGLRRWEESFISTFFFQIHPFITLAAIYSVYAAVRKKDIKYAVVVWLVILVVLMQIKRIRYIIMVFPMLALMAAYGISRIREIHIKRFLVLSVFIFSLVIGIFAFLPFLQRLSVVNLKDAGRFVNSLEELTIEVFTLMPEDPVMNPAVSVPILDLFTKKNIIYNYDSEGFLQPKEKIEKSPLRFTWEYKNPVYYEYKYYADNAAVVVISENPEEALPKNIQQRIAGHRLTGVFKMSEGIFSYSPCVRVYQSED